MSKSHSEQRSAAITQQYVHQLITGEGRSFGRRWAITYLRHRFGHRARQLDVANTLKLLDPEGVAHGHG